MLARVLLSALAALALASGVSGQGNCVLPDFGCTIIDMTTQTAPTPVNVILYLFYEPVTNVVCDLADGSSISTSAANAYAISDVPGTFSGTVVPLDASNTALSSIQLTFQATRGTTTATGTITTPAGTSVNGGGLTVAFQPLTGGTIASPTVETLRAAISNSCAAVRGDPLFSGFKGQQFFISGVDGQVLNILSTFNMQLNGRLAQMEQGSAMVPDKQEEMRLRSEAAHLENPAVAAFPSTIAWSHPGTYFSEAGVALLDEHRLYVKAGPFSQGWAKASLDGRPLAVSDNVISLGQGVNTTYIARISAHQVMVRTVNVEYTLTNSDNFLNVDRVHLEKGVKQHNHFAGILGNTVDAKWNWQPDTEKEATVESGDLFERGVVEL